MDQQTVGHSLGFHIVKVALIVFQILSIIVGVILIVSGAAGLAMGNDSDENEEHIEELIGGIIGALIAVLGLVGSIGHKWILTLVFGVIILLVGILDIIDEDYWSLGIDSLSAILAFVFVYLIRKEATDSED